MLKLYHAGLTACSKKARLCLKEKGLDYVSHFVSLTRFEHLEPGYLKLNPDGLVPTLVHDGAVVTDSNIINEYLDDVFPEIPLRPTDPLERARCRKMAKLADEALGPNMVVTFSLDGGMGKAARELNEADRKALIGRLPLVERKKNISTVTSGGYSKAEFAAAREKATAIVNKLEATLDHGPYLAGATYSLADINLIPFIHRYIERVVPDAFSETKTPKLLDWYARVMERPAVRATWAESDETRPAAA